MGMTIKPDGRGAIGHEVEDPSTEGGGKAKEAEQGHKPVRPNMVEKTFNI
jgi:hypothetical protein